ncbi:unnamed protein product [Enterobius vermicularis]|uniref:Shugoshin_C domain-containing protein n=1 Tax=Enterobius vermicularis TaxID=51028 RepID=A0A0N4V1F9_ENTVE|nr:unnamed protein product [Enterobius vermicularis]
MNSSENSLSSFLEKKGIASAFAQANRSLIERNKVLNAEVLYNKAEAERLRATNAELRAAISVLESGIEEERINMIIERRMRDKLLRLQTVTRRAIGYMQGIIKEFDNVLCSTTLFLMLIKVCSNQLVLFWFMLSSNFCMFNHIIAVEESPRIVFPVQRESISPLTSREGTTPNNSGDFKETDVVNDSLEEGLLTQSCSKSVENRSHFISGSQPSYVPCKDDLKKLLDSDLFKVSPRSSYNSIDFRTEETEDNKENDEENSLLLSRRYFEPTQRRREQKSKNNSLATSEQSVESEESCLRKFSIFSFTFFR